MNYFNPAIKNLRYDDPPEVEPMELPYPTLPPPPPPRY